MGLRGNVMTETQKSCQFHHQNIILKTIRPILKKTNPGPEIKPRIRIAGVPTELHFFLDAWLKRNQISGPGFVFLNMGLSVGNCQTKDENIY